MVMIVESRNIMTARPAVLTAPTRAIPEQHITGRVQVAAVSVAFVMTAPCARRAGRGASTLPIVMVKEPDDGSSSMADHSGLATRRLIEWGLTESNCCESIG